ncbi:hypothetical protein NEOLEDRAFT_397798 [Neolentinus lepideus HHB14362 ss-1]|uniref:Uncharacterized protein n=1 Tax=Neolentinus lepideus HHB14362 ss-1 TaxID=1314782 RepID=A0A165S9A1_9AGAM|nr:hypothetical protein NEOLEDRAFT_397798 [Neolentinus lepideus HHB14362 ss-1]
MDRIRHGRSAPRSRGQRGMDKPEAQLTTPTISILLGHKREGRVSDNSGRDLWRRNREGCTECTGHSWTRSNRRVLRQPLLQRANSDSPEGWQVGTVGIAFPPPLLSETCLAVFGKSLVAFTAFTPDTVGTTGTKNRADFVRHRQATSRPSTSAEDAVQDLTIKINSGVLVGFLEA